MPIPGAARPTATGRTSDRPGDLSRPPLRLDALRAPIPRRAGALAADLVEVERGLPRAVARWLRVGGGLQDPGVRIVELGGLRQQKIYRALAAGPPPPARRVLARVPRTIARRVGAHVAIARKLRRLATPLPGPIRLETADPAPPKRLRAYYARAQRRFGIPWNVLAAVNFVESRFGRVLGPSSAGAIGPMQFLPSTWRVYGRGDIRSPRDSIMAAARFLRASGAPEDMRGALYAYNHSYDYVASVLLYAREMARDERSFYRYYFWQVFVRTARGDVQLTGPGATR
ncbi:MAG: lytic transglycosylase domain-containing protein [Actinomycetota bacterium]